MTKNLYFSAKIFNISLLFGLLCAVFLSLADFDASCEDLRENVLRLHIIANSDSTADQELKLKIRDKILESSEDLFENVTDINSAIDTLKSKTQDFEHIAEKVIKENGFDYSVKATVDDSFFETREYDNFTLPAGVYKSLIITVGKGEGKNWWCVIFPEVCLPTASNIRLDKTVKSENCKISENSNKYVMRFKTVEIYEKIKKAIEK